jgi:hypothetical protein
VTEIEPDSQGWCLQILRLQSAFLNCMLVAVASKGSKAKMLHDRDSFKEGDADCCRTSNLRLRRSLRPPSRSSYRALIYSRYRTRLSYLQG